MTAGGWQGEGVSAGDDRLLYTHNTPPEQTNRKTNGGKKKKKLSESHSALQLIALMSHISCTNVPLHPDQKDYLLLISEEGVGFICRAYLRRHLTCAERREKAESGSRRQFWNRCQTHATKVN